MILDKFPNIDDFYQNYWGKQPFVIKGAISTNEFKNFIDGDTLAGLSLEDEVKSRLVTFDPEKNKWSCEHGPLDEKTFSKLGEENWSLLVQGVDQYHEGTAKLLEHFNFSPRWLLDDIMVSYSAKGGSVGPHTDSYHVFLVQGIGKRRWRIGTEPIKNEEHIDNPDLKVLKNSVEGQEVEVNMGDVIYIPPHFAHEGTTVENAMTFSVGFLGPKTSELLIEYGYYLEAHEEENQRYEGQGLTALSAGLDVTNEAEKTIQDQMMNALKAKGFNAWLSDYFSADKDEEF